MPLKKALGFCFAQVLPPGITAGNPEIYYELKFEYLTATSSPPLNIKCKRKPETFVSGFFILFRDRHNLCHKYFINAVPVNLFYLANRRRFKVC